MIGRESLGRMMHLANDSQISTEPLGDHMQMQWRILDGSEQWFIPSKTHCPLSTTVVEVIDLLIEYRHWVQS